MLGCWHDNKPNRSPALMQKCLPQFMSFGQQTRQFQTGWLGWDFV